MKLLASVSAMFACSGLAVAADMNSVLPDAKPGECYARVMIPAQYRTEKSTVVVREASERLSIVPAKYEWDTERVLVSEAGVDLKVMPATFKTETEVIEVAPAESAWVTGSMYSSVKANPGVLSLAQRAGVPVDSAESGQCFAEYFKAPTFETVSERVLVSEASESIKVQPARYEWVEKQQMIASATQKMIEVPASFETVQERVLVEDAKVVWKKGRGAVEKIDNASGVIMCLVEIPAVYKTIEKTVMKAAPASKMIEVPAKFENVRVRKLVEPARQVRTEIPARYRDVSIRKKVSDGEHVWLQQSGHESADNMRKTGNVICKKDIPAKTTTISKSVVATPATVTEVEIPAKYQDKRVKRLLAKAMQSTIAIPAVTREVNKRVKTTDARLEWRPVLCETNTTQRTISKLQQALSDTGYHVGDINGEMTHDTQSAIEQFQRANGMATGGLTLEVLNKLGISPG
jgi:hypothetical protein